MYWEAITILEAQDMLLNMKLQDYPHIKQADRKKFHKDMSDLAYPKSLNKSNKPFTLADFAKSLALGGGRG